MAYSTDLFDLIKALSRTEKAYIKKYGYKQDKDENNVYWRLFDAIDKQVEYEEEKLLHKFRGHKITKQFASTKNYLYNLILSSLTDYDESKDVESQLMEAIKEIKALRKRSLHSQAYKKLETAKKVALKEKESLLYRRLLKLELYLLPFNTENFKKRDFIYKELKRIDTEIAVGRNYNELYSRWMKAESEIGVVARVENKLASLDELMQSPLLQDESHAVTFNTQFQFNELHWRYFVYRKDYPQALQYAQKMMGQYEKQPAFIKVNPIAYLMSLDAVMLCESSMGDIKAYEKTTQIFRKAREYPSVKKLQKETPGLYYGLESSMLSAYTQWKHYEKALPIVPTIEANSQKYHQSPSIIHTNHYLIALTYFYNEKFEKAMDKIMKLMNDKMLEETSDLACFTRILHLVTHFELGNDLMVAYNIRSTYRYLLKRKRLFKVEGIVLRFLRKTPDILDEKALMESLKKLQNELQTIASNSFEKQAFAYFNFIDWIESKLQRVSMLELVKKDKEK